jgi:hypothetical protein
MNQEKNDLETTMKRKLQAMRNKRTGRMRRELKSCISKDDRHKCKNEIETEGVNHILKTYGITDPSVTNIVKQAVTSGCVDSIGEMKE